MNKQKTGEALQGQKHAKSDWRAPAVAAACILGGYALMAYLMPPIMLWLGQYSLVVAVLVAILFVMAFFGVFWLRARSQNK
jgi:hypothetical protein